MMAEGYCTQFSSSWQCPHKKHFGHSHHHPPHFLHLPHITASYFGLTSGIILVRPAGEKFLLICFPIFVNVPVEDRDQIGLIHENGRAKHYGRPDKGGLRDVKGEGFL